jgi:hypothetical protein
MISRVHRLEETSCLGGRLPTGAGKTLTFNVTVPAELQPSVYTVSARLDPGEDVPELNEGNNFFYSPRWLGISRVATLKLANTAKGTERMRRLPPSTCSRSAGNVAGAAPEPPCRS